MDNSSEVIDIYCLLDVTVPEAVYEAGRVSTVAILLRNPFNKPVEILEVQGPRSSHLSEVIKGIQSDKVNEDSNEKNGRAATSWFNSFLNLLTAKIKVTEVRFGAITAEFPTSASNKQLNIRASGKSNIEIDTELDEYDEVNVRVADEATVKFSPKIRSLAIDERKSITIEPHCEAVAYFQITTVGWLFFTPTRKSLYTLVKYRVDGKEKTQVVTSEFDVRPPLLSMVIGSLFGSLLGTTAKVLNSSQTLEWQPILVSIGSSAVMSLIATIALSRKTGTQGFITVEDFFGGFVVGALIGYGGSTYFEKALIPKTANISSS